MTGLYPWLGYKLSDRVSVWGVTGYGKGSLTLTPGEAAALTSGLSMAMAAAGTRGALVAGRRGRLRAGVQGRCPVGRHVDRRRRRTRWEFGGDRGGGDPVQDVAGGRAGLHARWPAVAATERRCRAAARRRARDVGRVDRAGRRPAGADAGDAPGRRVQGAGHGAVAELQPDAVDAAAARLAAEVSPPPERIDYAAFFKPRTFDHRHVVKPADYLVRYRYPFVCGLNDPSLFPLRQWRECVHDSVTAADLGTWATDYSAIDDELLIEQLTYRVLVRRGIVARPDEVLVTMGGQQALYLAIKLLLARGQTLGVEDPGYPDVVNMARIEGVQVQRLPVDEQGLVLSDAIGRCHCLFVTPSHHFPTTVTMPLARKRALLALTATHGPFIIEDDYEAEVSFNKTPPAALKSLDRRGNVIHAGGLSKSFLQGLRIGYLVADREFIREARALRHHILRHPPVNNQRSVALFL